jgi:arsenate reductase
MKKENVLFVCIHNSARSQMAEAFLNQLCGHEFVAHSAGLEPGQLNPHAVEAMGEIGLDISGHQTKSVDDFLKSNRKIDRVITVCDETNAERCPVFPGQVTRLHWSFPDPSQWQGSQQDKLAGTRQVRDAIKKRIEQWCAEVCSPTA